MALDIALRLRTPPAQSLQQVVFSFNPALAISRLRVDNQPMPFTHEQGLLTVRLAEPLAPGGTVTLAVSADGIAPWPAICCCSRQAPRPAGTRRRWTSCAKNCLPDT